ncbi:hypothetical protein JW916_15205 [Candidatus Sumerlaeota bacterium]|nr:hypothetical protein [Candidatus Sumerlaeota bacterium]
MKPSGKMFCVVMVLALMAGAALAQTADAPATGSTPSAAVASAPIPSSLGEAAAVVVVGDLSGLIDRAGVLMSQLAPGMDGMMLRSKIGSSFGDPTLAGMPAGSGLAVVVFPSGSAVFFSEVAPSQIEAYRDATLASGEQAEAVSGLLVSGDGPTELSIGKNIAEQVKGLLAAAASPTAEATIYPPRILAVHGPTIESGIVGMTSMMGAMAGAVGPAGATSQQNPAQLMEMYFRTYLSVVKQVETVALRLSLDSDIVKIEKTIKPVAASNLAQFLGAPVQADPGLAAMIPAQGALRGGFFLNPQATADFLVKEITDVTAQMQVDPAKRQSLIQFAKDSFAAKGSGGVMDMFVPGQASVMSGSSVYEVGDAAAYLDVMRNMEEKMRSAGLMDMAQQSGAQMTFEFKENVRQHAGVPVNLWTVKQEMPTGSTGSGSPAEQINQVLGFNNMVSEIAIVGSRGAITMGGMSVDSLVDAVQAGQNPQAAPIAARSIYGDDTRVMLDVRPAQIAQIVSQVTRGMTPADQPNPMDMVVMAMSSAQPIQAAARWNGSQIEGTLIVPFSTIASIGQAIMAVQMQMMMQSQAAAAGQQPAPAQPAPAQPAPAAPAEQPAPSAAPSEAP